MDTEVIKVHYMDGQGREGPVWCTLISPPDSYACKHACGKEEIKKCDHMKMLSQLQIYLPALKAAGLIWHITRLQYRLHIAITYYMAPFRIGQVTQQGTGNSKCNYYKQQLMLKIKFLQMLGHILSIYQYQLGLDQELVINQV